MNNNNHRKWLQEIAHQVILDRGLLPDFSKGVLAELEFIHEPARVDDENTDGTRDLRNLPWSSIDNDDSLDLDQLTVAESLPEGRVKILVSIADVDSLVKQGMAIYKHALHNTTSIYTPAQVFPMLPEKLSTGLTSLNPDEDRLSIVIEMVVDIDGAFLDSSVYRAVVRNHAKLAYNSVAAWLDGRGEIPREIERVKGLDENLRLQDEIAQKLKQHRHARGALSLETIESRAVFDGDNLRTLEKDEKNRARELIEDFMIAANGITARFLSSRQFPSIRRVVRTPRRWDRIVEIAIEHGVELPEIPDAIALENFLKEAKRIDPLRFPDLSLSIIKLLGNGEYIAELPEGEAPGHFGLAVRDYAHSTAPNRRFPDLLTQRLLKAAIDGNSSPYSYQELVTLADHCTEIEDVVNKIERQLEKSSAALLLQSRIGEEFNALVTGAAPKGTWVRLITLPVEGKLVAGTKGVDVGDRIRVRLVSLDVEKGYIDFNRTK